MYSAVDICNLALAQLGEQRIIALTENSRPARFSNIFYYSERDALLTGFEWNFAVKRVAPGLLSDAPLNEFSYQFQLPSDCLRLLSVYDYTEKWRVEGSTLLIDASAIEIRYIAKIEDPGSFPIEFVETLAARLAWRMARPIADLGVEQINVLWQDYERALRRAYVLIGSTDGARDDEVRRATGSTWVSVRGGSVEEWNMDEEA